MDNQKEGDGEPLDLDLDSVRGAHHPTQRQDQRPHHQGNPKATVLTSQELAALEEGGMLDQFKHTPLRRT